MLNQMTMTTRSTRHLLHTRRTNLNHRMLNRTNFRITTLTNIMNTHHTFRRRLQNLSLHHRLTRLRLSHLILNSQLPRNLTLLHMTRHRTRNTLNSTNTAHHSISTTRLRPSSHILRTTSLLTTRRTINQRPMILRSRLTNISHPMTRFLRLLHSSRTLTLLNSRRTRTPITQLNLQINLSRRRSTTTIRQVNSPNLHTISRMIVTLTPYRHTSHLRINANIQFNRPRTPTRLTTHRPQRMLTLLHINTTTLSNNNRSRIQIRSTTQHRPCQHSTNSSLHMNTHQRTRTAMLKQSHHTRRTRFLRFLRRSIQMLILLIMLTNSQARQTFSPHVSNIRRNHLILKKPINNKLKRNIRQLSPLGTPHTSMTSLILSQITTPNSRRHTIRNTSRLTILIMTINTSNSSTNTKTQFQLTLIRRLKLTNRNIPNRRQVNRLSIQPTRVHSHLLTSINRTRTSRRHRHRQQTSSTTPRLQNLHMLLIRIRQVNIRHRRHRPSIINLNSHTTKSILMSVTSLRILMMTTRNLTVTIQTSFLSILSRNSSKSNISTNLK